MKAAHARIDVLLCKWGRWALRCESGALGFAASSILACMGDGDRFDMAVPVGVIDEDMEAVDGAVRRLPKILQLTVIDVYQFGQGKSDRKLAAGLGIHVDTMRKYLCEAHRKIALDISKPCAQNHAQSVIGEIVPAKIKPAMA